MAGAMAGQAFKLASQAAKRLNGDNVVLPGMQASPDIRPTGVRSIASQILTNKQQEILKEEAERTANKIKEKLAAIGEVGNSQKLSRQTIENFMKNLTPYIVLFLIILMIALIFKNGSSAPRPSVKGNVASKGLMNDFWIKVNNIFSFSHESKKIFRMISPLSANVSTKNRSIIGSGRCNNIEWLETDGEKQLGSEGEPGYCETTILPDDIKWKLDTSRMPEYGELPKIVKDKTKEQLDIIIPWGHNEEASFYVPQCDKAVFAKTCDPKDPQNYTKCKKADLLEDNGMTCKLREQTSLMYKEGRRCNNSLNVGIINPENYRILTLVQRLKNKINTNKNSGEMLKTFFDTATDKDRAIINMSNNKDLPIRYTNDMVNAKSDINYGRGIFNATMRSYIPAQLSELKTEATTTK